MFLLLLFLALALVVSFLCSIAEAVLLSVSSGFIRAAKDNGKPWAKRWEKLKADVESPLSAILSLNTIAHTIGAAGVGAQASVVFGSSALAWVSAVLTFLILVFSEIVPKTIGSYYWRQLAPAMATFLTALVVACRYTGIIWMTAKITQLISPSSKAANFDREEFTALASLGEVEGHLDETESKILRNLMALRDTRVKDIMTPRPVMVIADEKLTVAEFMACEKFGAFSRIPIYKNDPDNLIGFILRADILAAQVAGRDGKRVGRFIRQIGAVMHTQNVYKTLQTMIDLNEHIMLAVDEYGSVRGLVAMEDVVETLIGLEIVDELDHTEDMQQAAHALWQKRAARKGINWSNERNREV